MEKQITSIVAIAIFILACIKWWHVAKDASVRKYIILSGTCIIITVVFYVIGVSFDIITLRVIAGFIFIGGLYFIIKARLEENKAKKK